MKSLIAYSVGESIFEHHPQYRRGLVHAVDVSNGPSPVPLTARLRTAEAELRSRVRLDGLAEHDRVRPWREAFRGFGAKPGKHRPSHEAMMRRALRGDELPSINALVDIGNEFALKYQLPVGSHALDDVSGRLSLRLATGTERFLAFGSDTVETPLPSEVVFTEDNEVLTRRWVWRQAVHTLTLAGSQRVVFNVDALPPVDDDELLFILEQLGDQIQQYCGGTVTRLMLSAAHPSVILDPAHNVSA